MRRFLAASFCVLSASALLVVAGTPTLDGDITDGTYGASVADQNTRTGFGDNENELNQMFVDSDATNVYIGITGNIADNNAFHLWIDTNPNEVPGGVLATDDGSCPQLVRPVIQAMLSGTQFDDFFEPEYGLSVSVGKFPGQSDTLLVFAADLLDLDTNVNTILGVGAVDTGNGLLTGDSGVQIAIDNSNTAGVVGFDPNNPAPDPNEINSATTGIEIAIPKALLGISTPQDISLAAFITNNAQDTGGPGAVCPDPNDPNLLIPQEAGPCGRFGFASNQSLPGLAGFDNIATFTPGGCFRVDFTAATGNQWVLVTLP